MFSTALEPTQSGKNVSPLLPGTATMSSFLTLNKERVRVKGEGCAA